MKTIIYAILYVIVTPFWWFVMQFDNVLSKLYMHISIKLMESRIESNDKNENNSYENNRFQQCKCCIRRHESTS